MRKIKLKQHILVTVNGVEHRLPRGEHRVADDVADHWFVKAHSEEIPEPFPQPEPEPKPIVAPSKPIETKAKKSK